MATKESKAVRDRRADTEWIKDAVKVQDDGAVTVDYCRMDEGGSTTKSTPAAKPAEPAKSSS